MSKRVLIPVAVLAVLVVIGVLIVATFQLLGSRRMLATGLSQMTGREIQVEGPTKLRPGLVPGLRIEGVSVGPAEGSALRGARIGRLELVFALWPLVWGDFEVRRLELEDAQVVLEPSAATSDAGEDTSDEKRERFSLRQADVRNLKLEIRRDGAAAPTTARLEQLSLRSPDEDGRVEVTAKGEVEAIHFDLGGSYDPSPPASEASDLPSVEVDGTLAGASVSGRGSLDLSPESRSLSLRVSAGVPDLQNLSSIAQRDLPKVGPVHATGLVEARGETVGVSELELEIGSRDAAWLEVTGYVRDIANQRDFSLECDFGFDDVRVLAPLVRDPPHIGRVVGKANVHDRSGSPSVDEFTLEGGRPGVFEIDAKGHFEDVKRAHGLDAQVDLKARDLTVLGELIHRTLPPIGPVELTGKVTAPELALTSLGVSDLDLKIGGRNTAWLEVTGYVRDIANQRGFSLKSDFGFDDVRVLAPLVRDPPHIGRVGGKASVHDRSGSPSVEEFTLEGGRPGVFEIDAKGHFEDVKRAHGLDAQVDLKARDLTVLGELFHRTLPPVGPVEFTGRVKAKEGALATDHAKARLDRTRIQGSVAGDFQPDRRPRVTLKLEVPELHLDDIGIEPEPDSDSPGTAGSAPPRLFADTPFDLAWSQVVDAQLAFRADRVSGVGGRLLQHVELDGSLENGRLSLRHIVADVEGGSSTGSLQLDSRASPPTLAVKASADGLNLGRLLEQIDDDKAWSGALDAELDLHTQGVSPRALAAGLDGEIVVSCGGGTIATAHASLLTRDLFRSVRHVVGGTQAEEVLNCLIVDFVFDEGRGSARTLVIDTKDIVIAGEGEVDLVSETLDLRLVPRPRRASFFSTAATVQLKGPLTRLAVKIEKGSLVTSSTEAILDNVTSAPGVRRAWRMLMGGASDRSPCAKLARGTP